MNTKAKPWTGGYPNEVHKGSKIGHRPENLRRRDQSVRSSNGIWHRIKYRAEHHLPVRHVESNAEKIKEPPRPPARLEDYEAMSKEELIQELVRAKIVEARLKKGYEVKGAGAQKAFAPLDSKSTK